MNKKVLGIILGCIAVVVGVIFIITGVNQIRGGSIAKQPVLAKEEIQQALKASQGETTVYQNAATGMRLSYPKNWTKEEGQNGAVVFKLFDGAVNVRFISDDFTARKEPLSLKDYTAELMKQSVTEGEKQNVKIKQLSDSDTTLAGLPAHQWLYTVTLDAIQGHGMQIWTIKNNRTYVLTFTSPESLFETFLPVYKKLLESVVLTQ